MYSTRFSFNMARNCVSDNLSEFSKTNQIRLMTVAELMPVGYRVS